MALKKAVGFVAKSWETYHFRVLVGSFRFLYSCHCSAVMTTVLFTLLLMVSVKIPKMPAKMPFYVKNDQITCQVIRITETYSFGYLRLIIVNTEVLKGGGSTWTHDFVFRVSF